MIELIGFVLTVGAMLLSEFLMTTTPKQRLDRMYCRVAGTFLMLSLLLVYLAHLSPFNLIWLTILSIGLPAIHRYEGSFLGEDHEADEHYRAWVQRIQDYRASWRE